MKQIFLNLKRFDIPPELGGVNRLSPPLDWGRHIVRSVQDDLKRYDNELIGFTIFFPEAHIPGAVSALDANSPIRIGCQSVHWDDTSVGGNFGAFTTSRTANAMKALGCSSTIIGHCEERRNLQKIAQDFGVIGTDVINRILNQKVLCAEKAGLKVLYCIGETAEQQDKWSETLLEQLITGLSGTNLKQIAIAYEPVWAIGPGKTPPGMDYIQTVTKLIQEAFENVPVVYGGGLKADNAAMLSSISEISGGLIALTRFTGSIGFYPEEYLEIIRIYMEETLQ